MAGFLLRFTCVFFAISSLSPTFTLALPPVFNNVPVDANVAENEDSRRIMYILDVTDPEGEPITCVNQIDSNTNNHFGNEFSLPLNPTTSKYQLEVANGADFTPFDYDMIYWNRIRCNDGGQTSTATIYVHVVPGQDISWSFGGPSVTVPIDVTSYPAKTVVYTASATNTLNTADPLTHQFNYELIDITSTPALPGVEPFFTINKATGEIIALQSLDRIPIDIPEVTLTIAAHEEELSTYSTVTLDFTDQNTRPSTTVLDLTETWPESTPAGTTLFTLAIDDPDTQPHTIKWRSNPSIGATMFTMNGNNFQLKPGQQLNFETQPDFEFEFVMNDGLVNSDTYTYRLNVGDTNDTPLFSTSKYYATMEEGTAGSTTVNPLLSCTDEDALSGVEPLTYSIQPGAYSNMFSIDDSGLLTFAQDYDRESGTLPAVVTLLIDCQDDDGAADTAQLIVNIVDKNDNAPVVPLSTRMYSDNTMTPGQSVIGSIRPSDPDFGPNGLFCCTATSTSLLAECYAVTATCDVVLGPATTNCDFDFGTMVSYVVTVEDYGTNKLSSVGTIDVVYREIITTTTTTTLATTMAYSFWHDPANIALTVLATLLCLTLLGLLTYCLIRFCRGSNLLGNCFRYCRHNCCRRRYPPRPPTPITPPQRPRPPHRPKSPVIIRDPTPPPRIVRAVPQPVQVIQPIARRTLIPNALY